MAAMGTGGHLETGIDLVLVSGNLSKSSIVLAFILETSLRGPSPCHCVSATQLFSTKCRSGGEPLARLYPI